MFQKYLTQFIWSKETFPSEAASLASGERAHGEGLPGGLRSWRTSVCSMACRKSLSSTTVQPFSASSFSKHRLGLPSGSRTLREHCSKSRQLPTTDLSQVSTFTSVWSACCMSASIVGAAGNKQQVVECGNGLQDKGLLSLLTQSPDDAHLVEQKSANFSYNMPVLIF